MIRFATGLMGCVALAVLLTAGSCGGDDDDDTGVDAALDSAPGTDSAPAAATLMSSCMHLCGCVEDTASGGSASQFDEQFCLDSCSASAGVDSGFPASFSSFSRASGQEDIMPSQECLTCVMSSTCTGLIDGSDCMTECSPPAS